MLSILIPVFNVDVRQLVADLHAQCTCAGLVFEVLCFDDGSRGEFKKLNAEVGKLPNVVYREMPENMGRSAIRNRLGGAAKFPNLLFLDCDAKVVDDRFIEKYLRHAGPANLVCGGHCYAAQMPVDEQFRLHWAYGRKREVQTVEQRSKQPWHGFKTFSFLVPRAVLLEIKFDETLRQYGHEDTLFGQELARRQIKICHIDAPMEHAGLEPAPIFLEKTRQGLQNLHGLLRSGKNMDTRLARAFLKMKKWGLAPVLAFIFRGQKANLEQHLQSASPSLWLFDFYKLGYLASLKNN